MTVATDRPPEVGVFLLVRHADPTGVSGTGVVAEGIEFSDGTVTLRWRKRPGSPLEPTSIDHPHVANVIGVHCHDGASELVWLVRRIVAAPLPTHFAFLRDLPYDVATNKIRAIRDLRRFNPDIATLHGYVEIVNAFLDARD